MAATKTRKARTPKVVVKRGPSVGYRVHVDRRGLRTAMKVQRLNAAELARIAGISEGAVRNLTSGGRDTCNAETAAVLGKVLRLDEIEDEEYPVFRVLSTGAPE